MKIDFTTIILALNGQPFSLSENNPLRLKEVTVEALLNPNPDKKEQLPHTKHLERFSLAQTIYNSQESIYISPEDLVEIRNLVSARWPTVIAGPALNLLEGQ